MSTPRSTVKSNSNSKRLAKKAPAKKAVAKKAALKKAVAKKVPAKTRLAKKAAAKKAVAKKTPRATKARTPALPRYPYVHVDAPADESDALSGALWELGAQGLEERDATTLVKPEEGRVTLVASFADEAAARAAISAIPKRFRPRIEFVVGDAWRDAWRAHFKPTRLGDRLVIRPSWEPFEASTTDVVLTLDPGRAFGTGTHESTRLVLAQLDRLVRGGERVLDVGCGSGVLSVAALLLGAAHAVAIDVDADSVEVTRENAELNGVAARVEASTRPVSEIRGSFPLVLANIQADVLVPLAPAIVRTVAKGGTLVLSGLLVPQEAEILAAYDALTPSARHVEGEWLSLAFTR